MTDPDRIPLRWRPRFNERGSHIGDGFDEHVTVAAVARESIPGGVETRWRWSLTAYGGQPLLPGLDRGKVDTKEAAKEAAERAWAAYCAVAPDNRARVFAADAELRHRTDYFVNKRFLEAEPPRAPSE